MIGTKRDFVVYNKFNTTVSKMTPKTTPAYTRRRLRDKYMGPYWKITGKTVNNIQYPMIRR
ncbi:MAG: hypothetical protein ACFFDY_00455 [Candidatus Thorarchaeota archaeon]